MRRRTTLGTMAMVLVTGSIAASAAPSEQGSTIAAAGTAQGALTVDGVPLALRHAIAVALPVANEMGEPGDGEAVTVFLTPEPLSVESLKGVADPDVGLVNLQRAVLGLAPAGLVMTFSKGGFLRTIRHPKYSENDPGLVSDGRGSMPEVFGPDRVAGTVTSSAGLSADEPEEFAGHRVLFRVKFNAPVVHRFALRQLSASAGGGEPGVAYLRDKCIPPSTNDPKDPKLLQDIVASWLEARGLLPTQKDGKPLARADAVYEGWMAAREKRPEDLTECTLLGGSADGELAVLNVEGLDLTRGSRVRIDAYMAKTAGKWTFKRHVYQPSAP